MPGTVCAQTGHCPENCKETLSQQHCFPECWQLLAEKQKRGGGVHKYPVIRSLCVQTALESLIATVYCDSYRK